MAAWQRRSLMGFAAGVALAAAIDPEAAITLMMAALMPAFHCIAILRGVAIVDFARSAKHNATDPPFPAAGLPIYSILVPLYREANMASALDRPAAKRGRGRTRPRPTQARLSPVPA